MPFKWKLSIKSLIFLDAALLSSITVRLLLSRVFSICCYLQVLLHPSEERGLRDFLGSIWLGIIFSYSNALQLGASGLKGIIGLSMSRMY